MHHSTVYPQALRHRFMFIGGLLVLMGTVLLYAFTSDAAHHTGLAAFDQQLLEWFAAHRAPSLTTWMELVTNIFSPTMIAWLIIVFVGVWVWRKKEYWRPLLLTGALGAAFAIASLCKYLLMYSRPPLYMMIMPYETDYSFPSGHTIGIAVLLLVTGYLFCSRRVSVGYISLWLIGAFVGTAIVATSRLYLGYHWASDVGASLSLALIILGCVMLVDAYKTKSSSSRFKTT